MDIYKNLLYVENPGEEKFIYNDKTYYRYMDKIYIPNQPSELSIEDVTSLSEIRIKRNGDVIDYSYTKELITYLLKYVPFENRNVIIDFGCGGGILSEVLLEEPILFSTVNNIIGLDVCEFAINVSIKQYKKNNSVTYSAFLFDGKEPLELSSDSVGAVISSFVMHFHIYDNQLEELYRVLIPGGRFVYNDYIYSKYPSHTKKIISRLINIGFEVHEHSKGFVHPETGDIKMHKIVSAMKPIKSI